MTSFEIIDYIQKNKMYKEYNFIANKYHKKGYKGYKGAPVYLYLFEQIYINKTMKL